MNIVLVCLHNFQEYILINIKQLILLGHSNIYIITNQCFFERFDWYKENIILVAVEDLPDTYNYNQYNTMDPHFRNGFWMLSSSRFFYLYDFMKQYNIDNVIHLENDVLIYYNCDQLKDKFNSGYVYLPFDSFERNIASIMFIPNHQIFKQVLDKYDFGENDMMNFARIQKQTGLIDHFPIFVNSQCKNLEYQFVTKNFSSFHFIFDSAAIGQYLGGVDPRNIPGNTTGFINETCVIKYNNYLFSLVHILLLSYL